MEIQPSKVLTRELLNNFITSNNIEETDKKMLTSIFDDYDEKDGSKDNKLNEENTQVFIGMLKIMYSKLKEQIDKILFPKSEEVKGEDLNKQTVPKNQVNTDKYIAKLQVNEETKKALKSDPSFASLIADYEAIQEELKELQNSSHKIGLQMQEYELQQAERNIKKYVNVIQNWKDGEKGNLVGYNNISTAESVTMPNGQKAYKCDDGHYYAPDAEQPNIPDENQRLQ